MSESTATSQSLFRKQVSIFEDGCGWEVSPIKAIRPQNLMTQSTFVPSFSDTLENADWTNCFEVNKERSNTYTITPQKSNNNIKKFKTELCKNWELHGRCNYSEKCQFAHGRMELQVNPELFINNKYKSKWCKQYHIQEVVEKHIFAPMEAGAYSLMT